MVCNRCITVLKSSLEELSLAVLDIGLGKVTVSGLSHLKSPALLEDTIKALDFEIIPGKESKLVADIKNIIHEVFKNQTYRDSKVKFSQLLSEKLNLSYDNLSSIFSKAEGLTLSSYIIHKRIEKIKEYLLHTDISLTEIAFLMDYSSVFHLSHQFKVVTSLTPSQFKQINFAQHMQSLALN